MSVWHTGDLSLECNSDRQIKLGAHLSSCGVYVHHAWKVKQSSYGKTRLYLVFRSECYPRTYWLPSQHWVWWRQREAEALYWQMAGWSLRPRRSACSYLSFPIALLSCCSACVGDPANRRVYHPLSGSALNACVVTRTWQRRMRF
jgi:hypothetical protein